MKQPGNAERRDILRGQHKHLRGTIESTRQAAADAIAGTATTAQLQAAISALEKELMEHLKDEERLLEPVLFDIDAWGEIRLGLLRAEHAHQRAVLAVLTGPGAWPAPQVVAQRTLSLCADLITDMEFEERELLNDRVLHDDVIQLDASDA